MFKRYDDLRSTTTNKQTICVRAAYTRNCLTLHGSRTIATSAFHIQLEQRILANRSTHTLMCSRYTQFSLCNRAGTHARTHVQFLNANRNETLMLRASALTFFSCQCTHINHNNCRVRKLRLYNTHGPVRTRSRCEEHTG